MKNPSKKEAEARKWIRDRFGSVGQQMQIGMYEFHFIYDEEPTESHTVEGHGTLLAIRPLVAYRRAEVFISPKAIEMALEPKDREHLLDAIVHEVCHIHTGRLADLSERRYISQQEVQSTVEELTETMAMYVRENLKHTTDLYKKLST